MLQWEANCNSDRYSPFHKTLPKCSFQMHWISVRFDEMGDIRVYISLFSMIWWSRGVFLGGAKGTCAPPPSILKEGKKKVRKREKYEKKWDKREKSKKFEDPYLEFPNLISEYAPVRETNWLIDKCDKYGTHRL